MARTQAQINNANRDRGKEFERRIAKFLGFFRVPYSGSSVVFGEGDIRDDKDPAESFYMGECKSMTPKSKTEVNYIIKAKWLDDLEARSKKAGGLLRFLVFTKIRSPKSYVILGLEDFRFMQQSVDILRNWAGPGASRKQMMEYVAERWAEIYGTKSADNANASDDDERDGDHIIAP